VDSKIARYENAGQEISKSGKLTVLENAGLKISGERWENALSHDLKFIARSKIHVLFERAAARSGRFNRISSPVFHGSNILTRNSQTYLHHWPFQCEFQI